MRPTLLSKAFQSSGGHDLLLGPVDRRHTREQIGADELQKQANAMPSCQTSSSRRRRGGGDEDSAARQKPAPDNQGTEGAPPSTRQSSSPWESEEVDDEDAFAVSAASLSRRGAVSSPNGGAKPEQSQESSGAYFYDGSELDYADYRRWAQMLRSSQKAGGPLPSLGRYSKAKRAAHDAGDWLDEDALTLVPQGGLDGEKEGDHGRRDKTGAHESPSPATFRRGPGYLPTGRRSLGYRSWHSSQLPVAPPPSPSLPALSRSGVSALLLDTPVWGAPQAAAYAPPPFAANYGRGDRLNWSWQDVYLPPLAPAEDAEPAEDSHTTGAAAGRYPAEGVARLPVDLAGGFDAPEVGQEPSAAESRGSGAGVSSEVGWAWKSGFSDSQTSVAQGTQPKRGSRLASGSVDEELDVARLSRLPHFSSSSGRSAGREVPAEGAGSPSHSATGSRTAPGAFPGEGLLATTGLTADRVSPASRPAARRETAPASASVPAADGAQGGVAGDFGLGDFVETGREEAQDLAHYGLPGPTNPSLLPLAWSDGQGNFSLLGAPYAAGLSAFARRPAALGGAAGALGVQQALSLLPDRAPAAATAYASHGYFGAAPLFGGGGTPSLLSSSPFVDAFMQQRGGGFNLGAQPFATTHNNAGASPQLSAGGTAPGNGPCGGALRDSDAWWKDTGGTVWPELPALSRAEIDAGMRDVSGHVQLVRVEAHLIRSQVNAGNALGQYIQQGRRYHLYDVEGRLPVISALRGKILGFGAYGVVVEFLDLSRSPAQHAQLRDLDPSRSLSESDESRGSLSERGGGERTRALALGDSPLSGDKRLGLLEKTPSAAGADGERELVSRALTGSLRPSGSGNVKSAAERSVAGAGSQGSGSSGRRMRYAAKIMYWAKSKNASAEEIQRNLSDYIREELDAFTHLRGTGLSDEVLFHDYGLVVPQGVRQIARLPLLLRANSALFPDSPLHFMNRLIMYPALKCSLDMVAHNPFTREGLRVLVRRLVKLVAGLHALGLTHNDIKPQNFLMGGDGEVYIGDFAYLIRLNAVQECNKGFTIDYAPPELMACALKNGRMKMGPERDSWAVGVSAYRLACKSNFPFLLDRKFGAKPDPRQIAAYIASLREDDLETSRCGNGDRVLMSIILRLLQPDPAKRSTVDELVKEPFFQD
ncbi:rhoptry kinase family protein ROP25 [Besnoitia besnoiti]|uniref:Rhoptry kinase family protein ROP25 n=1 Tax=Besnoitia besnoiti TaxID=94643 RepID=A0A2A9MG76_BESBE|nr:rhoptry kinase family protein ROP25 [Besnoitia besnoiti]PFH34607.1 rhoptry kinase family protein ROP25 [Besnoitia besnoiti]